ncbi:hypothetical protein ACLUTX_00545 [Enterobacterales bacterium AE_CKDN230030158-1A_HGKHYDSX7]
MLRLLVRHHHRKSDGCILVLAGMVAAVAGSVVWQFAPAAAIPFSVAAGLLLHFMWRTPDSG